MRPIARDGIVANRENPEVKVDGSGHNFTEQIQQLEEATRHLNNAKMGINVDWLDLDSESSFTLFTIKLGT